MKDRLAVPLGDHEERVAIVRADGLRYAPQLVFGAAWVLLPWWLFFPFLRLGTMGWVVVGLLAFGGVGYLVALRARWFGTALVVTNERVCDVAKKSAGREAMLAFPWHDVVDIQAKTGFLLGSVRLVLRKGMYDIQVDGLRDPMAVKKLLHEVQCLHRSPKTVRAPQL